MAARPFECAWHKSVSTDTSCVILWCLCLFKVSDNRVSFQGETEHRPENRLFRKHLLVVCFYLRRVPPNKGPRSSARCGWHADRSRVRSAHAACSNAASSCGFVRFYEEKKELSAGFWCGDHLALLCPCCDLERLSVARSSAWWCVSVATLCRPLVVAQTWTNTALHSK